MAKDRTPSAWLILNLHFLPASERRGCKPLVPPHQTLFTFLTPSSFAAGQLSLHDRVSEASSASALLSAVLLRQLRFPAHALRYWASSSASAFVEDIHTV